MADADGERRGPIFVLGSMGSGSTLLRLMLDSHEHIAMPQETGFLRLALAHTWVPFWAHGGEWYGRLGLSEDQLMAELRQFYGGLFDRYARERGKSRWGDKTPFHVWNVELAQRVFPDAVYVGIVRHPGAVAVSLHERFRYTWQQAVGHWVGSTTQLVHAGCDLGDRFTLLRYEDLVRSSEPTMRALLSWLGEPWSQAVLAHHEVQGGGDGPREVEGLTRVDEPVDPRRSTRWTASLDDEARSLLDSRCSGLASFFGYKVSDADVLESWAAGALLDGDELDGRRSAYDGVDWSKRPTPVPENLPLKPPWPGAAPDEVESSSASWTRRLPAPVRSRWYRLRRDHPWIDPRRK